MRHGWCAQWQWCSCSGLSGCCWPASAGTWRPWPRGTRLQAVAEAPGAVLHGLGEESRALALINLGIAEAWAADLDQAQWHLEQGIALAHRTVRPI